MIWRFELSAVLMWAVLIAIVGGCAPLPPLTYPSSPALPRLALPYIPQDDFQCAASAVAMVMAYSGTAVPLEILQTETYSPDLHGSLQPALIAAGRRHGWLAWEISSFEEILQEVAAGRPVIILQNRGLSWRPLWHYAVVAGFDEAQGQIYLSSGQEDQRPVATRTVLKTWERGGSWGLLLLPPGALPVHATPDRLLVALAGLERVDAVAARPGYAAAVVRWPDHAVLATAYGNLLRNADEPEAAEAAYRAALRAEPRHVPALNNLADLLHECGRLDEAYAVAVAAVAEGGPYRAAAAVTLQEIEAARGGTVRP